MELGHPVMNHQQFVLHSAMGTAPGRATLGLLSTLTSVFLSVISCNAFFEPFAFAHRIPYSRSFDTIQQLGNTMVGTLQELTVELGPVFHSDNILTSTLYHDLASTERIDAFLDASQTPFSRTSVGSPRGRWKSVPKAVKLEETISQSLLGIIEQIRGEFPSNRTVPSGVSRAVRDTSNLDLRYENGLKMRPDMLVVAAGPSFEVPSRASECFCGLDDLGYTNAASIFEVRRQRAKGTDQEHLEQLGLHCQ